MSYAVAGWRKERWSAVLEREDAAGPEAAASSAEERDGALEVAVDRLV